MSEIRKILELEEHNYSAIGPEAFAQVVPTALFPS